VVWRFSPETLKITVDGTTTTMARPSIGVISPDAFLVGAGSYLATNLFKGDIAELAIFPTALTDAEVASLRAYEDAEWGDTLP
jgi:hypothetical protein